MAVAIDPLPLIPNRFVKLILRSDVTKFSIFKYSNRPIKLTYDCW